MLRSRPDDGTGASTKLTLLDLPKELHLGVINFLLWHDILALRQVNAYFHSLVPTSSFRRLFEPCADALFRQELAKLAGPTPKRPPIGDWESRIGRAIRLRQEGQDPYSTDDSSGFADLPCYSPPCLQWKSANSFSNSMRDKERALGQAHARTRICFDCGMKTGLYAKGSYMWTALQGICLQCGAKIDLVREGGDFIWTKTRWCENCVSLADAPKRLAELKHERRWRKYNKAMDERRRTHDQRRRMWRESHGVEGD